MFTLNVIGGARTDSIAGINTSVKYTPRDGDVIATENAVFVRVHLTATYGLHTTYPAGLCCLCGLIARFEEPPNNGIHRLYSILHAMNVNFRTYELAFIYFRLNGSDLIRQALVIGSFFFSLISSVHRPWGKRII